MTRLLTFAWPDREPFHPKPTAFYGPPYAQLTPPRCRSDIMRDAKWHDSEAPGLRSALQRVFRSVRWREATNSQLTRGVHGTL